MKKIQKQIQRRKRVRAQIKNTGLRLRISIFRSNRYLSAQLIDDQKNITLVSVWEKELDKKDNHKKMTRIEKANLLGELLATRILAKKIKQVKFDRGGYKYHGLVKAFAEGARNKGLDF